MDFTIELFKKENTFAETLKGILRIQKSFEIIQRLISEGIMESDSGFLISSYDQKKIEFLVGCDKSLILIARDRSKNVIGYIISYSGSQFHNGHTKTNFEMLEENKEQFLSSFKVGKFIYINQIGVSKEYQGKGVAKALIAKLEK